jgi:hypothetical protein
MEQRQLKMVNKKSFYFSDIRKMFVFLKMVIFVRKIMIMGKRRTWSQTWVNLKTPILNINRTYVSLIHALITYAFLGTLKI